MNRIDRLFQKKSGNILSVYFTAGFPVLDATPGIVRSLANAGVDMIEIGIPFSDPMADGPIIQQSNDKALKNGMSLAMLFQQLKDIRRDVEIPLLLMGYLNPVLQFGMQRFCVHCAETGIDGAILPDMPIEVFKEESQIFLDNNGHGDQPFSSRALDNQNKFNTLHDLFNHHNFHNIFLISPQTSTERLTEIDRISRGFIYMVSASSTTGIKGGFSDDQIEYFRRIEKMNLKNPRLIGFGISDHSTYKIACNYAHGAIIGSAFVKMLSDAVDLEKRIGEFVKGIRK